jgi:hypothetical protein
MGRAKSVLTQIPASDERSRLNHVARYAWGAAVLALVLAVGLMSSPSSALAEEDTEAPVLRGLSFEPSFVNTEASGQKVRVLAHLTDNLSGVANANAQLYSPSYGAYVNISFTSLVSGSETDGIWAGETTIPRYSEHGAWHLDDLILQDQARNTAYYGRSKIEELDIPDTIEVTSASQGPPDFGRCVRAPAENVGKRAVFHGVYSDDSCLVMNADRAGKYEWETDILHSRFETSLDTGTIRFATVDGTKITCATETGTGYYDGAKQLIDVALRFGDCDSRGQRCTTTGFQEGELATTTLAGVLGWQTKATKKAALDLAPASGTGPVMEYTCIGGFPTVMSGSVVVPVVVDKMRATAPLRFKAKHGIQSPQLLEGEATDVLTASFGGETELIGLTANLTQVSEEAIEINAVA